MKDENKNSFNLDKAIRKVSDFPKPGILFYDITSVLMNPEALKYCVDSMVKLIEEKDINAVAAVESRGFLFAAPVAYTLKLPIILLRKKGKLPGETYRINFALEYGEDTLEVHKSDIYRGMKVAVVDDLIATGGTLKAASELVEKGGAVVAGIFAVIGLPFLNYNEVLLDYDVVTLIQYQGK
ncbi:MAG: adenine phosphoribosyltransferase [Spirochaetales bacterium]|nr:adenine phosphoribosyltransferase [Spirochaetales bacterium]RKX81081.1 MAG: adenine phosphoribosyltransferase [Spirochaetota bacterium]